MTSSAICQTNTPSQNFAIWSQSIPVQKLGEQPPLCTGFTPLTAEQLEQGFLTLLGDGKDTKVEIVNIVSSLRWEKINGLGRMTNSRPLNETAWKSASGAAKSVWQNNVLTLTGGSGSVESVENFGDFLLQLEYKADTNTNSGVFFRCIPGQIMNGYECQIFHRPPMTDFQKYLGTETGGLFRRAVGRSLGPKDGEWNHVAILVKGNHMFTWVNGIPAADWTDDRTANDNPRNGRRDAAGTIQLQGHDPSTNLQFRNFRIVEIR